MIRNAETMTAIERETFPEYDHHQLAGESNLECHGLNSRESEERCDPLPREPSCANEVIMEQVERCELDATEGPSLGRLQLQTMLQKASAGMLRINSENGALLATATAAMQSQNAMADDCRAHLAVLHAELDEVFCDRPSDCYLRAAESIYLVIDTTEADLEQIENDALAVLATMAECCTANAARAVQLQAHAAELLCRMGELNTHVTTGQAILSDANARNAAPPRPYQPLPAMGDTSATVQYVAQSRLPLMHSSNQMATTLGSDAGWPVTGASAPPTLPVFEAREPTANSAVPRNDNDTYFDNGDGTFHCETPLCSGRRPPDKMTRPNRSFILRHATSYQRTNEGAVHGMGARRDAHTQESGLRSKLTPPECATTASSVAPGDLGEGRRRAADQLVHRRLHYSRHQRAQVYAPRPRGA